VSQNRSFIAAGVSKPSSDPYSSCNPESEAGDIVVEEMHRVRKVEIVMPDIRIHLPAYDIASR
jgi:hypothetical protein